MNQMGHTIPGLTAPTVSYSEGLQATFAHHEELARLMRLGGASAAAIESAHVHLSLADSDREPAVTVTRDVDRETGLIHVSVGDFSTASNQLARAALSYGRWEHPVEPVPRQSRSTVIRRIGYISLAGGAGAAAANASGQFELAVRTSVEQIMGLDYVKLLADHTVAEASAVLVGIGALSLILAYAKDIHTSFRYNRQISRLLRLQFIANPEPRGES